MRLVTSLLALVVTSGLVTGCGSDPVDVEGNWMLVGAQLPEGRWDPEDPGTSRYFLKISEDDGGDGLAALGFAGCEEYTARIVQDGGDLDFEDFESASRPGCDRETIPDPLEGNLPSAVEAVTSVEKDGDLLVMRGDDTTLTFREHEAS